MEGRSLYYYLGIIVGVAVCLLLIRLFKVKLRMADKNDVDERQLMVRYKAWRLCCYIYMIELGLLYLLEVMGLRLPMTGSAKYMTALLLPIGVYAVYCIFRDAYLGLHANRKRFLLLGTVLFLIEALATVSSLRDGEMVVNGELTDNVLYPLIALLWLVILAALLIRARQTGGEGEG